MEQMIKLTIAVPTYNGAKYIRQCLNSILEQIESGVEVLISDNASTDETPKIVQEYQSKFSCIRYICNERNLGADTNFDLAVRRSLGEYVWLFGDDDTMKPGAIGKVLRVIAENPNLAAIFVNYSIYSQDMRSCKKDKDVDFKGDVLCVTSDEFLKTVRIAPIFISANIVQRRTWIQTDTSPYIGSNWIQFGTLMDMVIGRTTYCIEYPYVNLRTGAARWKNGGQFYKNTLSLYNILAKLPSKGYSEDSVEHAMEPIITHLSRTIRSAKREGLVVDKTLLQASILAFNNLSCFWFKQFPLLVIPGIVYRLFYGRYIRRKIKEYWGRL